MSPFPPVGGRATTDRTTLRPLLLRLGIRAQLTSRPLRWAWTLRPVATTEWAVRAEVVDRLRRRGMFADEDMYQAGRAWLLHCVTVSPQTTPTPMLITAAAGYGKSALLEAQRPDRGVVSSALTLVSDGLPERVSWIGVDDFDAIAADDQARLVGLLAERQDVGVAIASRTPVSAAVRDRLRGQACERDAADLALTPYEIARLLADESGVTDPEAALRVAELTAGWPTLVRFAGDALGRDAHVDLAMAMTAPGSPAADWIRSSVLDTLPAGAEDVLRAVACIDTSGSADAGAVRRRHRWTRRHARPRRSGCGARECSCRGDGWGARPSSSWCRPSHSSCGARSAARRRATSPRSSRARTRPSSAWLPAARAHAVAGDRAAVARLIGDHGEDMLRRGDAGPVARLVEQVIGECARGRVGAAAPHVRRRTPDVRRPHAGASCLRAPGGPRR